MEMSPCPPVDVWEDFHARTLLPEEDRALEEHLSDCAECRRLHQRRPKRRDRSMLLATIATALFGLLGFGLVLMVSLRTPRPQPTPAPQPDPAALTTILESVVDASGD